MHVTVVNPGHLLDSPAYDGPADEAHTRLAPGVYDCDYADEMWGKLVVTEHTSYLVPGKTVGELEVGDNIDVTIGDDNSVVAGRVEAKNPSTEHGSFGYVVSIRAAGGTLHRYRWHPSEHVAMVPEVCPLDGEPLSTHIGGKPCVAGKSSPAKSVHDLPIASWALKGNG